MARTHSPGPVDPIEAMARILVAALLPALEAAMLAGLTYRQTMADARRVYAQQWLAAHGPEIAARAGEILSHVGPAAILTPYGRELFLAEYPPGAIPNAAALIANDNAPPPHVGIVRRAARTLIGLFRWPPG
ncbi:hypothetical protein [Methylobacterium sp. PvR107]|uniref:hypothetical protein n=1 Tax=Methylobacterium sp. PvR107 TaxID=2806597 RepID=UPI001AE905B1|nr:hypothetical protein [Methylobacterium sp. PvR107]MBP1180002.1 hypothetical protein [Methylobacterium sp. PvR107]